MAIYDYAMASGCTGCSIGEGAALARVQGCSIALPTAANFINESSSVQIFVSEHRSAKNIGNVDVRVESGRVYVERGEPMLLW